MAHEGLWEQLIGLDGHKTAQRAQCRYVRNPEGYIIKFLNTNYAIDLSKKQILSIQNPSQQEPAEFLEQLCILAYLINAKDMPLTNKLVKGEILPGGQFFFRGVHGIPVEKLEKAFGSSPEALYRITERFSAEKCEFGDAAIKFSVLPRIPLTIVIWKGDEEFGARASVLFDQTAANHMPLDALLAAVNLAVEKLVKAVESSN
jgi:hypothetical protein